MPCPGEEGFLAEEPTLQVSSLMAIWVLCGVRACTPQRVPAHGLEFPWCVLVKEPPTNTPSWSRSTRTAVLRWGAGRCSKIAPAAPPTAAWHCSSAPGSSCSRTGSREAARWQMHDGFASHRGTAWGERGPGVDAKQRAGLSAWGCQRPPAVAASQSFTFPAPLYTMDTGERTSGWAVYNALLF